MPVSQVFCSSCGSAQLVEPTPGPFYLQCELCRAITVGLGANWLPSDEFATEEILLPAQLSFREKEAVFTDSDASLTIEMALRGPYSADAISEPILQPAALSAAELSFLYGQTATA